MKTVSSRTVAGLLCLFGFWMVQTALAAQEPNGRSPAAGPMVGSGPYKAIMEMDPGLPGHTIYRPDDLSALNGTSLPIVVWGNGACANAGNFFAPFLTEISSYGYLVVALGPIMQLNAAGFPSGPAVPPRPQGTDPTSASDRFCPID